MSGSDTNDQEELGIALRGDIATNKYFLNRIDQLEKEIQDLRKRVKDIEEWQENLRSAGRELARKSQEIVENLDLMLTPEDRENAKKYLDKLREEKKRSESRS